MNTSLNRVAALALAGALCALPVLAKDKEDKGWEKEQKRAEKAERKADKEDRKADKEDRKAEKEAHKGRHRDPDVHAGRYFDDRHREHARRYYHDHYVSAGKCPPGLAKKNNGCMPPGQARKWAVGQQVPRDVVVYEVPRPILVQLPPAPVGYRYERLGGDIVLVRVNGRIVVDILVNVFI